MKFLEFCYHFSFQSKLYLPNNRRPWFIICFISSTFCSTTSSRWNHWWHWHAHITRCIYNNEKPEIGQQYLTYLTNSHTVKVLQQVRSFGTICHQKNGRIDGQAGKRTNTTKLLTLFLSFFHFNFHWFIYFDHSSRLGRNWGEILCVWVSMMREKSFDERFVMRINDETCIVRIVV